MSTTSCVNVYSPIYYPVDAFEETEAECKLTKAGPWASRLGSIFLSLPNAAKMASVTGVSSFHLSRHNTPECRFEIIVMTSFRWKLSNLNQSSWVESGFSKREKDWHLSTNRENFRGSVLAKNYKWCCRECNVCAYEIIFPIASF